MAWVTMPQLGETVVEGTIGRWLKGVGERVEQGEPVVEVVTDKVNAEVVSEVAGEIREILVPEGGSAAPGARLALVADADEPQALAGPAEPGSAVLEPPATLVAEEGSPEVEAGPPAEPAPIAAIRVTPAVQRLARENGVDLGEVPGTGPGGRVTVEDVLAFLVRRRLTDGQTVGPGRAIPAAPHPAQRAVAVQPGGSATAAALAAEVDLAGVADTARTAGDDDLLVVALVVKAVADALAQLPGEGPSAGGAIGVEVMGPGGSAGIVRDPGRLSPAGVARAIRDEPAAASGTADGGAPAPAIRVVDAGRVGALSFVAPLAAGQAIAVAIGAVVPRPVALESDGGIAFGVRRVAIVTVAYDPVVVPPGAAAAILAAVRVRLEAPGPGDPVV